MKDVHPDGKVVDIKGDVAQIEYKSGGVGFIPLDKMPKGVKVGDRVIVTMRVTLESVELAK